MNRIFISYLSFILFLSSSCYATTVKQINKGNLAWDTSQEPSPLFSVGQNIVDRGNFLILETWDQQFGPQKNYELLSNSLLYGINNDISILATVPVIPQYEQQGIKKSGIGDLILQGEWAFYNRDRYTYSLQSTFIMNMTFPTGKTFVTTLPDRNPNLGFGGVSVFLGGTFSYLSVDWYAFTSGGAVITTRHHCTNFGNQYFYEAGVGYRLGNVGNWLFNLIVEFNGIFLQNEVILGQTNPRSGGNCIFLGPDLYIASQEHFIFIAGIQFPITQNLQGIFRNHLRYSIYGAWKF